MGILPFFVEEPTNTDASTDDYRFSICPFVVLPSQNGIALIKSSKSESFGNSLVVFCQPPFTVRILSDRRIWFIELSEESKPEQWYDTSLLREAVVDQIGKDEMTLDEKVSFWEDSWPEIKKLFKDDAGAAHVNLDRRRMNRAKRMFPIAYS